MTGGVGVAFIFILSKESGRRNRHTGKQGGGEEGQEVEGALILLHVVIRHVHHICIIHHIHIVHGIHIIHRIHHIHSIHSIHHVHSIHLVTIKVIRSSISVIIVVVIIVVSLVVAVIHGLISVVGTILCHSILRPVIRSAVF